MPRWKTLLPPAAAVLALAGLAPLLLRQPPPAPAPVAATAPQEPGWTAVDFQSLRPGSVMPGWEFQQGALSLVSHDGRTLLRQMPDPMTEGIAVQQKMLPGGGAVRARFRGGRIRRATPRFALGMLGEVKIHFRAVPSAKSMEIVRSVPVMEQGKLVERDAVQASAPWQWQPEQGVWLEFSAAPARDGGWEFEGRVWPENTTRPADASLRWSLAENPGLLRAAVMTAPFALRPVDCDAILTRAGR